jgi:uncharacterized protein
VRLVHELIRARRDEIETLCRTLGVHRLNLFGSATGDSFDVDTSDVDVLVEFATPQGFDYFDAYFRLKEGARNYSGQARGCCGRIKHP